MDEHGTVFIPAAIAGNEDMATFAAMADGVPCVEDSGHVYLPSGWIARECPRVADVCELIERQVRGHLMGK
jgi:hypothetical protein